MPSMGSSKILDISATMMPETISGVSNSGANDAGAKPEMIDNDSQPQSQHQFQGGGDDGKQERFDKAPAKILRCRSRSA